MQAKTNWPSKVKQPSIPNLLVDELSATYESATSKVPYQTA